MFCLCVCVNLIGSHLKDIRFYCLQWMNVKDKVWTAVSRLSIIYCSKGNSSSY